jgi:hypothetical protein
MVMLIGWPEELDKVRGRMFGLRGLEEEEEVEAELSLSAAVIMNTRMRLQRKYAL